MFSGDQESIETIGKLIDGLGRDKEAVIRGDIEDETYRLATNAGVVRGITRVLDEMRPGAPHVVFMKMLTKPDSYTLHEPKSAWHWARLGLGALKLRRLNGTGNTGST